MRPRPPEPPTRTWFMRTTAYRLFMIREFTSVFLAGYLIFLLVLLARVGEGPQPFDSLLVTLRSPISIILHVLVLLAALYHAVTWFNLTPRIMPVRLGEERLPDAVVAIAAGYLPWIVVSLAIGWAVLG